MFCPNGIGYIMTTHIYYKQTKSHLLTGPVCCIFPLPLTPYITYPIADNRPSGKTVGTVQEPPNTKLPGKFRCLPYI